MHLPGLSRSGSGTAVVLRGTDSIGLRFVPFPGPSSQVMRCLGSTVAVTYCLLPFLPLSFLGVQLVHLSQADVDHPESQEILAKKPACSLVDDASLGPQLPSSGSGCLSPEGNSLQPASSVQSFVL